MRRKEREISDPQVLESIINSAKVCRLAMCEGGVPFVVPLCFGYEKGALYFHSAIEGRKLEILKKNPRVSFEMDIDWELVRSGDHCNMRYRSVIGFGKATLFNNFGYPAAKVRPSQGSSIATIEDLLQGIVKEVNPAAEKLGLKVGLTGREALELL